MRNFLLRRVVSAFLSLIGATFVVFTISVASDDPLLLYAKPTGYGMPESQRAALSAKLGLDKPIIVQYLLWIGRAFTGDLGESIFDERPVTDKIEERVGVTLKLGIVSWLFATLLGVPMGILSAVKRASVWDYLGRGFALFGQAVPNFWLGIMMIFLFAVRLDWLPSATAGEGFFSYRHYVMPVFVLGTATAGGIPSHHSICHARGARRRVRETGPGEGRRKHLCGLEACAAQCPDSPAHRIGRAHGGIYNRIPDH